MSCWLSPQIFKACINNFLSQPQRKNVLLQSHGFKTFTIETNVYINQITGGENVYVNQITEGKHLYVNEITETL